jgi:hypothetical protein
MEKNGMALFLDAEWYRHKVGAMTQQRGSDYS